MIAIEFNTAQVVSTLTDVQKRQIPFATQLTLNRTQESRQQRLQTHITTDLTIRNASTKEQFRKVVRFAREDRADRKAARLEARLRILGGDTKATAPIYQRLGGMVLRQDEGGPRTSSALYRAGSADASRFVTGGFAMPAPGLRTSTKAIQRKLYPYALGLTPQLKIAGGDQFNTQYKGGRKKKGKGFRKGTKFFFVKEGVGIFVREQVGKNSEYDAVWFFRQRINLPKRLRLDATYQDGLGQELNENFAGFLSFALRTAK
jgi:hypothetical protein